MGRWRSKYRGICRRCGHERTLVSITRGYCKPCSYEMGHCIRCMAYRKIYVQGRCYLCYQDDLLRVRLDRIQAGFVAPASSYNQYLFELYLTYLRRHRMSYDHLKPTIGLTKILSQSPVHPILRWNDVYRLSRRYPLTRSPGKSVHDNGCAWTKMVTQLLFCKILREQNLSSHSVLYLGHIQVCFCSNPIFVNLLKNCGDQAKTRVLVWK